MPARLLFITGSKSGTSVPLAEGENTIGRRSGQTVVFSPDEIIVSASHATITYRDGRFVLRDETSRNGTFVNQERVEEKALVSGDVIEFGLGGPSAQFVFQDSVDLAPTLDVGGRQTPSDLLQLARARAARRCGAADQAALGRSLSTTREFVALAYQRSSRRTRLMAAVLVVLVAAGVATVFVWQQRGRTQLEQALAEFAMALETERGSRAELARNLADVQARYDSLLSAVTRDRRRVETNVRFGEKVTREYSRGVALIVFSYGFSEPGGTELLRYQVDARGRPITTVGRDGRPAPRIGFGGNGPALQAPGSATGFLVDSAGWIVTNRHVAVPWEYDEGVEALRRSGLEVEPRFVVLQAYFPPGDRSYPLVVHETSEQADVALLRSVTPHVDAPVLPLAPPTANVVPGEQVVLIGYPTGVHNLLFRVAPDDRAAILNQVGDDDPIRLARELANRGLIQPLVTNGSVSDTTGIEVIHTSASTGGGSGGPLITSGEQVVAIHYAAVRSPISGDPFQTQRGIRASFAWDLLPADVRRRLGG